MKHLVLIFSILLLLVTDAGAAPVIFIVRHAEKASSGDKDPDLSVGGTKTRGCFSAYSEGFTDYLRLRYRIKTHAAKLGHRQREPRTFTPTVLPANDIGALFEKLHALNGNALVVGHGNTIPGPAQDAWRRDGSSAFLMTITPKSLSYWSATPRSCSDCIIHFDKMQNFSRREFFASHNS